MATENIAGHMPGRGHVLDGVARKEIADQLRRGDFMQEMIGRIGVNLESMTKAHLLRRDASDLRKAFVDELRGDNGMFALQRVGSGQIIIFAGIDDDASRGVNAPGEEMINEGALHINIAENNAVER